MLESFFIYFCFFSTQFDLIIVHYILKYFLYELLKCLLIKHYCWAVLQKLRFEFVKS